MTIHVRNKGHNGEREACRWLEKQLNLEPHILERNIDQVREGGADIMSLVPFAIEIKRQENLLLNNWWRQAVSQTTGDNHIPVLMFRQNRRKWRFCMSSTDICKKRFKGKGYRVELSLDHFLIVMATILARKGL